MRACLNFFLSVFVVKTRAFFFQIDLKRKLHVKAAYLDALKALDRVEWMKLFHPTSQNRISYVLISADKILGILYAKQIARVEWLSPTCGHNC